VQTAAPEVIQSHDITALSLVRVRTRQNTYGCSFSPPAASTGQAHPPHLLHETTVMSFVDGIVDWPARVSRRQIFIGPECVRA